MSMRLNFSSTVLINGYPLFGTDFGDIGLEGKWRWPTVGGNLGRLTLSAGSAGASVS